MGYEQGERWARRWLVALLLAIAGLATPAEVRAHGLGFHVAAGAGENFHGQFGLSWDTAVARDSLLNFRMNLGYERFELKNEAGNQEDFAGGILEETLGVRLLANERLRLWAGPQLSTGLYNGDLGIGYGVALGGNLHFDSLTSLGLTVSLRRMEYSGFLSGDEKETVAALRLDFFFRLPRDDFRRTVAADAPATSKPVGE